MALRYQRIRIKLTKEPRFGYASERTVYVSLRPGQTVMFEVIDPTIDNGGMLQPPAGPEGGGPTRMLRITITADPVYGRGEMTMFLNFLPGQKLMYQNIGRCRRIIRRRILHGSGGRRLKILSGWGGCWHSKLMRKRGSPSRFRRRLHQT